MYFMVNCKGIYPEVAICATSRVGIHRLRGVRLGRQLPSDLIHVSMASLHR